MPFDSYRARGCLPAVLILVLLSLPAGGKPLEQRDWIEVRTQNFRIHSILSEKESLEIARKIELFHAAASIATGFPVVDDRVPTQIYLLKKPRDFVQLGIFRDRQWANISSYSNHTIISREDPPEDVGANLRHSYAHLFVRGRYPFWLESGMADYLTPTRQHLEKDGLLIGLPDDYKLKALRLRRSP